MISARFVAVIDASPLVAAIDNADADHARCREILVRPDMLLVVPVLALAEVSYLVGSRLGPDAEARFFRTLPNLRVETPLADDWLRIADLIQTYRDFPLGGVDASVVALAERLNTDLVITLDRRHFAAVRPKHVSAFRILPD